MADPKPLLFKFAFGVTDEVILSETQAEQLQEKLHEFFKGAGNPPWGYADEDPKTKVKEWTDLINSNKTEKAEKEKKKKDPEIEVDLTKASAEQHWYVGGEGYACLHAPVFVKGKQHRWTIELREGDTKKEVPISFQSLCLLQNMRRKSNAWRVKFIEAVNKAKNRKEAEHALRDMFVHV